VISYLDALDPDELLARAGEAPALLGECRSCPRRCGAKRTAGKTGTCLGGRFAGVTSFHAHRGEESCVSGTAGSGTIFFGGCNLRCAFCQNFEISHRPAGKAAAPEVLAAVMVSLQESGCHNINLVTPSHVAPQILEALPGAIGMGLELPLVWNSSGYDLVETLRLFDGIVDIYMPDFKFWDPEVSRRYCDAPDYPEVARAAIREMHRQVGDLVIGGDGIAQRGLLVRHLVMPGGAAGTREVMRFLAHEVSPDTYVNLMDQWRPAGESDRHPALRRDLLGREFNEALDAARAEGIKRFDSRGSGSASR
jgi:putative pyruvate formate lyase activating enzyme